VKLVGAREAGSGRRRRYGRRWLVRAGLVALLAGVVQTLAAGPASAHAVGGLVAASNYRTEVRGIEPAIPGVTVRVVDRGNQIELTNRGPEEVTVLGYQNEPYLRVGAAGVFENERSPSTFCNRSTAPPVQIPSRYDASAQPEWRRISSRPVAIFHDHRAHWSGGADPAAVRRDRGRRQVVTPSWQVPLRVGDRTSILSGSIEWVPGPSPLPWAALAAALAALVLLASRGGWQAKGLAAVTALAVAADVVHTVGTWVGSTASIVTQVYGSATSFAGWLVAAMAIHRLLTGKLEAGRTFMLLAAIFLALAGAAPDAPALARSQLASGLDPTLTRAAISATLGLGAGMLLVALLGRQLSGPRPAPAGAARGQGGNPRPGAGKARRPGGDSAGVGRARSDARRQPGPGGTKRSKKSGGR
jgi:hypothetical protein